MSSVGASQSSSWQACPCVGTLGTGVCMRHHRLFFHTGCHGRWLFQGVGAVCADSSQYRHTNET